jgi:Insertion element 4 transposase N-terminal
MPPAGQLKPPVLARLSDRVAIGALTATFPPELVDQVLAQTGRTEQRRRLLPAGMVVYYLLALALFADVATWRCCGCWWRRCGGPAGTAG